MSEYSFGGFDPDDMSGAGEPQSNEQQAPKWYRDRMDKVSEQLQALVDENNRLKAEKKQQAVADELRRKGYAPQAAGLFQGDPAKLDEWLTANGGALARIAAPEGEQQPGEQAPSGPPPTTVPAAGQEQMQRMQEQGTQGVAPPQGSDKELSAAIAACQTPEEFEQLMKSHGSPYDWQ